MSYEEFRRRIDTARNILVGAVPSPAGQIDQITYALMYKFMNDIDDQSAAIPGGKRSYFIGEHEKFNWHKLMASSLGAQERLDLYRLAIQTMSKNENLPPLFREIYQNAFLPFNSANVLNLFLKEMDKFDHGDSDDIGDAYEYLLSITGAQGDVGQFRTPRHIIKFIVDAINPTKDDSVLDPACGTAGFLISAYNHVKSQHDGKDENGDKNNEKRLSADELSKIHKNYHGFDIDPTMVRTAEVNMYLHGFTTPDIRNHDTLSSEDFWNEKYDVILANPPFMTPKGGIQPHKKFSINANRAEVLFVDYIASHINPVSGRAGIVVPEGVIFQSGNAYKQLRKNLVENSLFAVISLPAGVFQPYSGVKTSILLLDKKIAKEHDEILFIKIENDGYSLGAQRRAVSGEQFSEALEIIEQFKTNQELDSKFVHSVSRKAISDNDDYNLSGDRYIVKSIKIHDKYPVVSLADLENNSDISFLRGANLSKNDISKLGRNKCIHYGELYTLYNPIINNVISRTDILGKVFSKEGDVLVPATTTADPMGISIARSLNESGVIIGGDINIVRTGNKKILADYLSWVINYPLKLVLATYATGVNIYHLSNSDLRKLNLILPPIEVQREIVAELDNYQRIIDAAQIIVKNYKPIIKIKPEWKTVKIGDISTIVSGYGFPHQYQGLKSEDIPFLKVSDMNSSGNEVYIKSFNNTINNEILSKLKAKTFPKGTIIFPKIGAAISTNKKRILTKASTIDNNVMGLISGNKVDEKFLFYILININISDWASDSALPSINKSTVENVTIKIPPIEVQREIVAEIEIEQRLIDANKKLIEIYQQKIKDKLAEIWGN